MTKESVKENINRQVDALSEDLFAISRHLYENPETAYEEYNTSKYLGSFLSEKGFDVTLGAGGIETAFFARLDGVKPVRPTLAFLAEYDALPKIGHGCGHNLIAAASIGGALALLQACRDLAPQVVIVGTPAEEGGGGKARLADGGVFMDVDAGLLFHPGHKIQAGNNFLGRIKAKIEFFGQTSHAAGAPEKGRNALDAIIGAFNNVAALRQHVPEDVRIHGIITHGGDAPNIIPDYTAGLFYIRSVDPDYLKILFERFKQCCQGAALAAGCEWKFEIMPPSLDPIKRNYTLEGIWKNNALECGLKVDEDTEGPSGSTDVGNLSWVIPVAQSRLSISEPDVLVHSVGFADATQTPRGQQALLDAARLLAMTAYDYLTSPEVQKAVAEEFDQK